jgi:hypothetical protein
MHSRLKITALLTATAAVLGAATASPGSSHSDATSSQNLTLVGRETASAFLHQGGEANPVVVGSEFVSGQRLFRRGKAVGRSGGSCRVVAPAPGLDRNTFQCTVTLDLPSGQISVAGLGTFGEEGPQPMTMAITGGTGSYRKARGQATVRERLGGETLYRLSIRG